jgi:2-hydroxy-4-carboxymuconate semialdehyde hemiacetal dehydrogenase
LIATHSLSPPETTQAPASRHQRANQLRTERGAICTMSLSTYIARHDLVTTRDEEPIDVTQVRHVHNGIELRDRELVTAIETGREPNSSVAQVLGCYRVLGELEMQLNQPG